MRIIKNLFWLYLGFLLIALALEACQGRYTFHGTTVDPPQTAPDFTLTDNHGKLFQLSSQKGNVFLLYFGYTHCPDICPLTLGNLARDRQALGTDGSQVKVVFVTTDPGRDTPEVLQRYLGQLDSTFVGLSGDWSQVSSVLQKYFAAATRDQTAGAKSNYSVDHTTYVYVIDQNQYWRAFYGQDSQVSDITSDVHFLLRQKGQE